MGELLHLGECSPDGQGGGGGGGGGEGGIVHILFHGTYFKSLFLTPFFLFYVGCRTL